MKLLAPGLGTAAALWLLRKTMQKVPFTGRLHFVFVPACVERALGANAFDGEAHDYARCTAVCVFFTKKKGDRITKVQTCTLRLRRCVIRVQSSL